MNSYLEHANMHVGNLDEAIRFLTIACPEFTIRHDGVNEGKRWVHLGTETSYIALAEGWPEAVLRRPYADLGINHLAFVVDDADALRIRLLKAGYREGFVPPAHPQRKRVYFHDGDGFEWEFIQYYSEDPAERNDYSE